MNNIYCFGLSEKIISEIKVEIEKISEGRYAETEFIRITNTDEKNINPTFYIIKPEYSIEEVNGVMFAEEKRKEFPQCEIIFLSTNYMYLPEIVCRGIKPSGYFILPIRDERFTEMIVSRLKQGEEMKKITVISEYKKEEIPLNSILYFTAVNKKIECRMDSGKVVSFYDTMSSLESRMGNLFLRCHSGFLINVRKIISYPKNMSYIQLKGCDDGIPVSRKYKNFVGEKLAKYNKGL